METWIEQASSKIKSIGNMFEPSLNVLIKHIHVRSNYKSIEPLPVTITLNHIKVGDYEISLDRHNEFENGICSFAINDIHLDVNKGDKLEINTNKNNIYFKEFFLECV